MKFINNKLEQKAKALEIDNEWRQIVDVIPDLIMILDDQQRLVWMNKAMVEKLNPCAGFMVGRACYNLVHGTKAPIKNCPFKKVLANGRTYQIEMYEERIGGSFCMSLSPVYDSEGRLSGVIHVARDISHMKQAEKDLRKSETRYRAMSEATFEAIFIFGKEGCLDTNQAATKLFGYEYDELIGIVGTELMAPEFKELFEQNMLSDHAKPYKAIAQKKNGTKFHVEIRTNILNYNGKNVRAAVIHDINEQKHVEKSLRKSEAKYKTLIQNMPDIIFSANKDGKIVGLHLPDRNLFGLEIDEIIGRHFLSFICSEDRPKVVLAIKNSLQSRSGFLKGLRCRIVSKNGSLHWVEVGLQVKFDDQGVHTRSDGIIRDINDLKDAEEKLKLSNRDLRKAYNKRRALSEQLIELLERDRGQIAMELHDHMGQALITIRTGFSMIVQQLGESDSSVITLLKSLEEKAIHELIKLKNISYEIRPHILDHLGLVPSIRGLIEDFEKRVGMQIQFFHKDIPRKIKPKVALALYRIVQESLANIIKHARAGEVYINLVKKGDGVVLIIEDDGIGFDKEKKTISSGGRSLLGIRIMRERAKQAGGDFTIESQIGRGTQVLAEVPL